MLSLDTNNNNDPIDNSIYIRDISLDQQDQNDPLPEAIQIGEDIDGEAFENLSGYAVSLSADGSVLAIGAPINDGNGNRSGHVRIYHNSNGSWEQIGEDIDGESAYDCSGHSVSLSAFS